MPLIKCPDCGSDVSSFVAACPKCGYPIAQAQAAQSKKTRIKLPPNEESIMGTTLRLIDDNTGEELARGGFNAIVEIDLKKPVTLALLWGLQRKAFSRNYTFRAEPHKCYALTWSAGWMMARLVCNEVTDFIGV